MTQITTIQRLRRNRDHHGRAVRGNGRNGRPYVSTAIRCGRLEDESTTRYGRRQIVESEHFPALEMSSITSDTQPTIDHCRAMKYTIDLYEISIRDIPFYFIRHPTRNQASLVWRPVDNLA
jgi:hypothetical protein